MFHSKYFRALILLLALVGSYYLLHKSYCLIFKKETVRVAIEPINGIVSYLKNANSELQHMNNLTRGDFVMQMDVDPNKVRQWKNKSDSINTIVDSIVFEIDKRINEINSNTEAPDKEGRRICELVSDLKSKTNSMVNDSIVRNFVKGAFPINDDWQKQFTKSINSIAEIAYLEAIKNYTLASESKLGDYFYNHIYSNIDYVTIIEADVEAKDDVILQGREYKARVSLKEKDPYKNNVYKVIIGPLKPGLKKCGGIFCPAAVNPVINGGNLPIVSGAGEYIEMGHGEGEYRYSGAVETLEPAGNVLYYPFESKYTVLKRPNATPQHPH